MGWKNGIASAVLVEKQNGGWNAVSKAMMELGVAGGIGSLCVEKGIVDEDSLRILSKLTVQVLLPMLLSTSILSTFATDTTTSAMTSSSSSSSSGKQMVFWVIPVMGILHIVCMLTLSDRWLSTTTRTTSEEDLWKRMTVVCSSFGNSAILPILMTQSFFAKKSPLFYEKCCSYISFYLMGWSPLFWSLGKSYLLPSSSATAAAVTWKMPPPVMGVVAGIVLGIYKPIRQLFLPSSNNVGGWKTIPTIIGSSIFQCVRNFGLAAAPLSLLVLTSSLSLSQKQHPPSQNTNPPLHNNNKNNHTIQQQQQQQQQNTNAVLWKQWRIISIMRFIISPTIMFLLLRTLSSSLIPILPSMEDDPALWFVLLLESCMPSAQNLVLLIQSSATTNNYNTSHLASHIAQLLYLIYMTAMIPIPIIQSQILQYLPL